MVQNVTTLSELVAYLTTLQDERQEAGLPDLTVVSDSRLENGFSEGIDVKVARAERGPKEDHKYSFNGDYMPTFSDTNGEEVLMMGHHYSM